MYFGNQLADHGPPFCGRFVPTASFAAVTQAAIGNVAAGSAFAWLTSLGAGGYAAAAVAGAAQVAGGVVAAGAAGAAVASQIGAAEEEEKIEDGDA